ncbi:MAG: cobalt ECF transporter T component CbiQ [Deltaproteobacteria bacterium]|nr:cobalt ECF transporter T component CbiQ [Deltaproteobacteria bacterium]
MSSATPHGPGPDERVRVLALLGVLAVCVATPASRHAALVMNILFLVCLGVAWRASWRAGGARVLIVLPVIAAVTLWLPFVPPPAPETPTVWLGLHIYPSGVHTAIGVALKVFAATGAAVLLSATVPTDRLWASLAWMRVPPSLVTGLVVTFRSIHVLAEEVRRMRHGLVARGYRGRSFREIRSIGRLIGALFVRSHERQERMYSAMVARGFDGHVRPAPFPAPLGAKGWVQAGAIVFAGAALGLFA